MKLKKITALCISVLLFCSVFTASASSPYVTYEYSTDNYNNQIGSSKSDANARTAPEAFCYSTALNHLTLTGLELPFNTPEDFICDDAGNIYVSDPTNKRIVVIDASLASVRSILTAWQSADGVSGDFSSARGLFIKDNILYVCLQDSGQILLIDISGMTETVVTVNRVITAPDLSAVTDSFSFKPVKVVADQSGRMYIIVQGIFDGLVSLDDSGQFLGYVGANRIQLSAWERFWRSISTTEQIDASADTVPVEYYGMDIDGDGFIYTTSKGNPTENVVRRLNLIGNDVLKTGTHYIKGELSPLRTEGTITAESNLVDIDVREGGIYTCLDNVRGRVFTYDHDGDLLFVFGGLSGQKGAFTVPCAVQWLGDELLVLDKGANEIVCFSPTAYGIAVIDAAKTQYSGQYGDSWDKWEQVLTMNPGNEIANRSVGKLAYDSGDYKEAMNYFRTANDTKLYSKAYTKYRAEKMAVIIPYAAVGLGLILLVFIIWKLIKTLRASRDKLTYVKEEARKYNKRRGKKK